MILNHLNLGVTDVPATVAMFENYFGLKQAPGFPVSPKMAFMTDDGGMVLGLLKVPDANYPKIFHIGFIQKTKDEVLAVHAKLTAGGFDPQDAREEHGRFTFFFNAPGGFTVEVNAFQ